MRSMRSYLRVSLRWSLAGLRILLRADWVGLLPEVTGALLEPKLKSILVHWDSFSMPDPEARIPGLMEELIMSGPLPPNLFRGTVMGGGGGGGCCGWLLRW